MIRRDDRRVGKAAFEVGVTIVGLRGKWCVKGEEGRMFGGLFVCSCVWYV